ncbi:MAG: hypothetical protein M3R69_09390 [Acidobacteriota bacterium]|nr:hypothetical protein [Acidobacteriota bacterium]
MKRTLIALFAPLLIWQAAVSGQSQASLLSEKQLAKAEGLVTKLERFEAFTQSHPSPREYKTRLQELSSAIYKPASNLPESSLRTDITTALHFYELAEVNREDPTAGGERCANEKPGAYQRLCEAHSGSRNELLRAKARLHVNWAKASVRSKRSSHDVDELLSEIEVERKNDQALAERALTFLTVLKGEVPVHASLADFEEAGTLARVSYETFKSDLLRTSAEVERILSWLPQNRLKFEISNALYSYQDGGMWWSRVYRPRIVNVSELASSEVSTAPSATAYQTTVPYTVAINWRQAGKYLERAEGLITRSDDPGKVQR